MAQNDKQHIGDNQNPSWFGGGTMQGLFINSLAGQYGDFLTDATFQNAINQNNPYSFSYTTNGNFSLTNRLIANNEKFFFFDTTGSILFIGMIYQTAIPVVDRRTSVFINQTQLPNMQCTFFSYDGTISTLSYKATINGVQLSILDATGQPDLIPSDTLYDNNTFRLGLYAFALTLQTFTIRDLCIYTSAIPVSNFRNLYHSIPTNNLTKFCEWKMAQLSDFYTFGGGLYARNTGTSGNGLDNGTGYDIRLFGYNLNIPILQSIY